MRFKTTGLFFIATLAALSVFAQTQVMYPTGDFINPLDIPLSLAGNFGELRGNHFHSGFDFRTNGEEGYLVKAVADGYVSRIKVSAFGYGNAVYITHYNGYVSVYGHLQRYDSVIANYVKSKQYELELFEVDLFPKKNELLVTQGQLIALSGNTGGSEGPHLHFEIRDEKTEEIINPYFFGFAIDDTVAPGIEGLAVYPMDQNARVNGSKRPVYFEVKKSGINTYALKEEIRLSGKIGFGLITFDVESGSTNKNGTYAYNLMVDTEMVFSYAVKRFAFDQTRYINAHIDYARLKKSNEKFQRCYLLPGNKIKHYAYNAQNGIKEFNDTLFHNININAVDFKNNVSTLSFSSKSYQTDSVSKRASGSNYFLFNKSNQFSKADISVELPLNCLYDDIEFTYSKVAGNGKLLSDIHRVHNADTPVHNAFILSIKPKGKALKKADKLLIVSIDEEGNPLSEGGTFEHGFVTTKTRSFGNFAVMIDTIAPTIKLLNFDKEHKTFRQNKIMVKMSDNLSGIKSYRGTIDGQWVLMEHDNKEKTITYTFDEKLVKSETEHIFVVTITDRKGNSKKITTKFIY